MIVVTLTISEVTLVLTLGDDIKIVIVLECEVILRGHISEPTKMMRRIENQKGTIKKLN